MGDLIVSKAISRRANWITEILKLGSAFSMDSDRLEIELDDEIKREGASALIEHLRLCGAIPESYRHDSSEEKLYSKYTDCLIAEDFNAAGLKSLVLKERADVADVEVFADSYSFVADAKCFRLSRTAKNQKDFKIQAMDGWKRGKPYAMVVCPIYQLPKRSSQIYEQAISRNVCIFTYSHLAMLVAYSVVEGQYQSAELIHEIFKTILALNPSQDAYGYWLALNKTMLGFSTKVENLWMAEKQAAVESIHAAKTEALAFLASEREKIMRLSHEEALRELVRVHKIESKMNTVRSVSDNELLAIR